MFTIYIYFTILSADLPERRACETNAKHRIKQLSKITTKKNFRFSRLLIPE